MKTAVAGTCALLVGLALLPAVLASGDPPPLAVCGLPAGPNEVVLATIREVESGGDYRAKAAGSSASGAYQFLDSTWNGYGGSTHAKDAPPAVQDAHAAELVHSILEDHAGDVSAVPVAWYIGRVPEPGAPEWDTVPAPGAGNRLTPRQYQTRWMEAYQRHLDSDAADTTTTDGMSTTRPPTITCTAGAVPPIDGEWSLPGPRSLIDANPGALNDPHHDYPAWDWLIPEGTPIYAIHGGTVVASRRWRHNWWTEGCDRPDVGGCDTCGVGVTIGDETGTRWSYCHGNELTTTLDATVVAGQQIMWSGNTGRSGTPHLHVELRVDGVRRCPQPLLTSLYTNEVAVHPETLPRSDCTFGTGPS